MTEPELTTSIKFQAIGVQVRDVDYGLLLGMTRRAAKAAEDLQRTTEKVRQTLCSLTLTYRDEWPAEPPPPRRVHGRTARQYRAARRAYRRAHQRWVRAGRPATTTLERLVYIPRALVSAQLNPAPSGSHDTLSQRVDLT